MRFFIVVCYDSVYVRAHQSIWINVTFFHFFWFIWTEEKDFFRFDACTGAHTIRSAVFFCLRFLSTFLCFRMKHKKTISIRVDERFQKRKKLTKANDLCSTFEVLESKSQSCVEFLLLNQNHTCIFCCYFGGCLLFIVLSSILHSTRTIKSMDSFFAYAFMINVFALRRLSSHL